MALIMVLGSLTILTIMLTEFQDETSVEFGSALSERDALKAEYAARSGIALTRLLIAAEPTIRKSLGLILGVMFGGKAPQIPVWELADDLLGAFNGGDGSARFSGLAGVDLTQGKNLGLTQASFELQVIDENSKININKAARPGAFSQVQLPTDLLGLIGAPQYNEFFEGRDGDGQFSDRQAICGAIVDWTDSDQDMNPCDPLSGVPPAAAPEDSFYQNLDPSYERKNAAFDSLEELHLVRGVTDTFWATFVEPDPEDPGSRLLTVWGQNQLNVNTANPQTIWSWVCGQAPEAELCTNPEHAAMFLSALGLLQMMPGAPLFGSPDVFLKAMKGGGPFGMLLTQFQVPPVTAFSVSDGEVKKGITVESKVFSIYATGLVKAGRRETRTRIHAVVDFRGAPKPTDLTEAAIEELEGQIPSNIPIDSASKDELPEEATEDAIAAALKPSPAGTIVYYRVN